MDFRYRPLRICRIKWTCELILVAAVICLVLIYLNTCELNETYNKSVQHAQNYDYGSHLFTHITVTQSPKYAFVSTLEAPVETSEGPSHNNEISSAHETKGVQPMIFGEVIPNIEMMNNTARAGANILFFNKMVHVGQTFTELVFALSRKNNFVFDLAKVDLNSSILPQPEQKSFTDRVSVCSSPVAYIQNVYHINFTRFGHANPIYVNMVRDPVESVISWFYYIRSSWFFMERKQQFPNLPSPDSNWLRKSYETCVLTRDPECTYTQHTNDSTDYRTPMQFFCGHHEFCASLNSVEALQRAKRVVEEQYAVVGVLEDMNATLAALERYVPRFFSGASSLYWEPQIQHHVNREMSKPLVSEEAKAAVRGYLTRELELYAFCRQRLYLQLRALRDPTISLP